MKDRARTAGGFRNLFRRFENIMAAAAFAEAGEHETALTLLNHEATAEAQSAERRAVDRAGSFYQDRAVRV